VEERRKKHIFADCYQKLRDNAEASELCSEDGVNQLPCSNFSTWYPVSLESQIDIENS
jgi:hypothetical protein